MNQCYLSEIYSGIQGEGPLVGVRQIFVRFCACDLRCIWCDTPESLVRTEYCELEETCGSRTFSKVQNPINNIQLLDYINRLEPNIHHSISLTGGEPLLQVKFLSSFLPELKSKAITKIYLEAGGHKPKELNEIIKYLDYVSMDIKIPSSAKTRELWNEHQEFISILIENNVQFWVKLVVTNETLSDEIEHSIDIVKKIIRGKCEIIIQPVSRINNILPPSEKALLDMHSKLLKIYPNIKVIPQVHKLIGQR